MFGRWSGAGGYREVLKVGLPLVVSLGSASVMQFTDRMFLSHYSLDAIAASTPAFVVQFLFVAFFLGTAEYVNVFVAQYTGAGAHHRVGAALWQGLWFCLPSGVLLALAGLLGGPIFAWAGHPPRVQELEAVYFGILCLGGGPSLLQITMLSFFSGRGLTMPVMVVNVLAAVVNIPLDYALINGVWIFPEWGIAGAAWATVAAWVFGAALAVWLVFRREYEADFHVFSAWRFDRDLFARLLRFGAPGGVQFLLDVFAFSAFSFFVGRLGTDALAATNIVVALDTLAFLPTVGLSVSASVLVGQAIGAGRPEQGARATWNTLHLAMLWMGSIGLCFLVLPGPLLDIFHPQGMSPQEFAPIREAGVVLLRFAAAFSLMDAMTMVLFGALKGAGDTRFVMLAMGTASLSVMVLPLYLLVVVLEAGLYAAWACMLSYITVLSVVFLLRFRQGKWRGMRVVEAGPPTTATVAPPATGGAIPTVDASIPPAPDPQGHDD